MSQGLQPVVGTNFGAKLFNRVRETVKVFSIGGLILAAIFWIPAILFSKQILYWFGVEADIIAQGVSNFRLFYSVFVLYGVMVMSITFFQSIGNGKKAGIIVMFRQLFLFIPAIILLPMAFGINIHRHSRWIFIVPAKTFFKNIRFSLAVFICPLLRVYERGNSTRFRGCERR